MALAATYGMRPGESLAIQTGQAAIGNQQRQMDRQFAGYQADQNRALQERMQKRALKQQAVLGGIQAGVGVASALVGGIGAIPGIVEGFRNLAGPTARQIQQDQFGQQMDLQRDNQGLTALTHGTQAGIEIAKLAMMKQQRQDYLSQAEESYGTDSMLSDIPQTFNNMTIQDAQSGDPMALQRARERNLMVTTPAQATQLTNLQRQLDAVTANTDGRLTPSQQVYLQAQIGAQMQAINARPAVNQSRMPTEDEIARSQVKMVPVLGDDGELVKIPMVRQSRGNFAPMKEHPAMVRMTRAAEILGEAEAQQVARTKYPLSDIAQESKKSGGKPPLYMEDGAVNLQAFNTDDLIKISQQISDQKKAAWEWQQKNSIVPSTEPPNFTATRQEMQSYIESMVRGPTSVVNQDVAARNRSIAQTLVPGGVVVPPVNAPTMVGQQMPGNNPVHMQAPFAPGSTMLANPPAQSQPANPLRAADPQASGNLLRQASQQQVDPVVLQKTYDSLAFAAPKRPNARRVAMSAADGNLPQLMGMEYLLMESDGESVLPVLPTREAIIRYSKVVEPGTRFINVDGEVRRIKEPAK